MKPHYMLGMTTALAVVLALALPSSVRAQGPALTGKVTSAAEGAMEGVVVTAHKDGSVVSVSVTTNAQGVYSFPEDRLEPGRYNLAIRAVGYDLAPSPEPTSSARRPRMSTSSSTRPRISPANSPMPSG